MLNQNQNNFRKYFEKILDKIDERQKNIMIKEGDNTDYIIMEVKKNYQKELKARGVLKKKKINNKCIKYVKKECNLLYENLKPSPLTALFHCLLKALDNTCSLLDYSTILYDKLGEEKDLTIKELDKFKDNSRVYRDSNLVLKFYSENLRKEFAVIDKRISNFLFLEIKNNDSVINKDMIIQLIEKIKKSIPIAINLNIFKIFNEEITSIKEISRIIEICRIIINNSNLDKDLKKKYRYNLTRLENFLLKFEIHIKNINIYLETYKHKKLVEAAFKQNMELPSINSISNYQQYLEYLTKRGSLKKEYKINGL